MKKWLIALTMVGIVVLSPTAFQAVSDGEIQTYTQPVGGH